jgi:hypothetical protein
MEDSNKVKKLCLANKKFVTENERYVEIYKITCSKTNKSYVGQTVSHILNNGKYIRHGMEKRLKGHISEAFSTKKNQCHYLNNAIRKYGSNEFKVELLTTCSLDESDKEESKYIVLLNTMYPYGYNLKFGTITTRLSEEGRRRVSEGVYKYYIDKKYERFQNIVFPLEKNIEDFIRPLNRNSIQYGWYVLINGKKADFGGIYISLEESKIRAIEFVKAIKSNYIAKHLDAGKPLEPKLPLL